FAPAKVISLVGSVPAETVGVLINKDTLRTSGANSEQGVTGEYFGNASLEGNPIVTRVDRNIDFDWKGGAPASGVPEGEFSVRWSSEFVPPSTSDYRFGIRCEGSYGFRLYVDG